MNEQRFRNQQADGVGNLEVSRTLLSFFGEFGKWGLRKESIKEKSGFRPGTGAHYGGGIPTSDASYAGFLEQERDVSLR
jgi:hypothetical protein